MSRPEMQIHKTPAKEEEEEEECEEESVDDEELEPDPEFDPGGTK